MKIKAPKYAYHNGGKYHLPSNLDCRDTTCNKRFFTDIKTWTICPYCGNKLGWKFLFISKRIHEGACNCEPPASCSKHEWIASHYEDVDWMNAPIKYWICKNCWEKITPQEFIDKGYKDYNKVHTT